MSPYKIEGPALITKGDVLMAGLNSDEYAEIRARLVEYIDHVENRRDGAKLAAKHYPLTSAIALAEADVYDDVADDLREMIKHWPRCMNEPSPRVPMRSPNDTVGDQDET